MSYFPIRRVLTVCFTLFLSLFLTTCQKEVGEVLADSKSEFLSFEVDGVKKIWAGNPYNLHSMEDTNLQVNGWYNLIGAWNTDTSTMGWIDMVLIRADGSTQVPMQFDIESIDINDPNLAPGFLGFYAPLHVSSATITEFGNIGEYSAGHFEGIYLLSRISGDDDTVNVKCSWRVKRKPI